MFGFSSSHHEGAKNFNVIASSIEEDERRTETKEERKKTEINERN
jgi:hypothetical protein